RLAGKLGANFMPLLFDVTDSGAIRAAADRVQSALGGKTLDGLVNNAGIAVAGPLLYIDPDEVRRQLEVNVMGQLLVTQAFSPLLAAEGKEKAGRVVMISSIGRRNATP